MFLAGILVSATASGQENPLVLRLGAAAYQDSNVYRLPDSAPDPNLSSGIQGKSDRYAMLQVGMRFEQRYSLQRVMFDVVDRIIRYDKFETLDRDELDYRGEWQMQLASRLSGTVRADRTESLINFEDNRGQQQNVATVTNQGISLDGRLTPRWHLIGGVSRTDRSNRQSFLALPDSRQSGADAGFRYVSPSENSVSVMWRSRKGANDIPAVDLVNFIDNAFRVKEGEISVFWAPDGHHALTARLTRTEYRYDNLPQRDFSGQSGEISHAWAVTAAFALNLSAQRSLTSWTADTNASYRVDDTFAVAPTWRFSEKTTVEGRLYRTTSEFRAPIVPVAGPPQGDTQHGLRLAVRWNPALRATVSASVQYEERESTVAALNFDATIVGIDASLSF